ncbi:MAG: PEP/pyruvate-binding domain-containing protein [Candidatus Omnitrophica bacterium]|nr:PEP/pyruvate-binding domain-containing protein [Candidatus Omnitrophota bacterium]
MEKRLKKRKYKFGTKAESLERLGSLLSLSSVPKFHYFTVNEWQKDPEAILKKTRACFGKQKVIVRSSASSEDGALATMAGLHDSMPDISADNKSRLSDAIDKVISSYEKSGTADNRYHQVLVQLMVKDISMRGVVFTQYLNTGAPYYVINYDDETGRTDTVTAGTENSNRTLLVHRPAVDELKSERFKALLRTVREIEKATGHDSLDIEFAVDKKSRVFIFQVRQIPTRPNWNRSITIKVNDAVKRMKSFVEGYEKATPGLYGSRTIFGKMPDWNPVEMIGTFPRPLALSLYRHLITDYAWREARRQMGYLETHGTRLMVSLSGKPYIDVRLSFNSFLPSGLDGRICDKLVSAWISRLSQHKELHDKIEFEIAITALAFDFDKSVREQIPGVLTDKEKKAFCKSLFNLTDSLLTGKVAPIEGELKKIEMLAHRRSNLMQMCKNPDFTVVSGLLEDCINLGTIPFSILARHAFIAKAFIRSMVRRGILTYDEAESFQRSIKTIASDLVSDMDSFIVGKIRTADFMAKYGHLRPGTYDILSKRYDQREDLLNGTLEAPPKPISQNKFSFSGSQLRNIKKLLKECGYSITPEQLLKYIKDATRAREYAKFIFTRNISDALEVLAARGEEIGLSREELSYLQLKDVLDTLNISQGRALEQHLRDLATEGRNMHEITLAIRLPYLIEKSEDVSIVPLFLNKPNFITHKTVRGSYVFMDGKSESAQDITGKIVLIENADPGFDWIFSRRLAGLITKFGGANSHMAIRCAEFGLPAAIGCGEQIFDRVLRSRAIEINCSEGRIEPIEV